MIKTKDNSTSETSMRQPHAPFLEKGRGRLIGTLEDDDEDCDGDDDDHVDDGDDDDDHDEL